MYDILPALFSITISLLQTPVADTLTQEVIAVYKQHHVGVSSVDLHCMTEVIYFEARGESYEGQIAVAEVVINRKHSSAHPNTVCNVINKDGQFTYNKQAVVDDTAAWDKAMLIAESVLLQKHTAVVGTQVTDYHAVDVYPYWAEAYTLTNIVGNHLFYERI